MTFKTLKYCCSSYNYLFYKFYSWHLWLHKGYYCPQNTACITLSFFVCVNLLTLSILTQLLIGYGFNQIGKYKQLIIIVPCIILAMNYVFFLKNKRYTKIINQFKNEDIKKSRLGNIFVLIFILSSFFFGFFFMHVLKIAI